MLKIYQMTLLAAAASALYPSSSSVIELTASNFDTLVINSDEIWIVEFFARWCGHCQQFAPEYQKAAKALKGIIKVGAVNAEDPNRNSLNARYGVKGFPTIKIFGADKLKPTDYNGERSAQGIIDAALAAAKNKVNIKMGKETSGASGDTIDVIQLTDSNFNKLVIQSQDMWLVEFFAPWCGHCKNLAPHWAQAAAELKGKVKLGALDATVHTLKASEYGVQGYPTIKYFAPGKKTSTSAVHYDGGRTASDIVSWALDKFSDDVPAPDIIQITNEHSMKEHCVQKTLCVIAVLPHILDCQSKCRNDYVGVLKSLGAEYKKKLWGWVWIEAGAQQDLENVLDIGGFGYPAMAVVNYKKMKYSLLRGSFSKEGINEFLREISFGRGNTALVKGAALPKIVSTEAWDGKDGKLPPEEIDLSDIDVEAKDEL